MVRSLPARVRAPSRLGLGLAAFVTFLAAGLSVTAPAARAEDDAEVPEAVRVEVVKRLGRDLARRARSPAPERHQEEILAILDSLAAHGGVEAARAALRGLPILDETVRDRIFAVVDAEHDPALLDDLVAILQDKAYRRDADAKRRIARTLSILQDPEAIGPLTELIRSDEDAEVVAAAADTLATFAGAPLRLRRDAVKELIEVYTTTWNLMMSMRPEDKVIKGVMEKRWEVYGRAVRAALQALTGQADLTRPQEWRDWWNENKKRTDW